MPKTLDDTKKRFYLLVEHILAFALSTNFVRKVKNCLEVSNELHAETLYKILIRVGRSILS